MHIFSWQSVPYRLQAVQPKEQIMQSYARQSSSDRQASAPMTPDRSSLCGAVIRLAAVFACAGAIQILAGWFLR
jgi:hypothetical protein